MVAAMYVAFAAVAAVICVTSMVLNSLICLVFFRHKKLLKAPDIFILNVALSDLFYSVATLPLLFVANVYGGWIFGPQGCKATAFISTWSGLSSLMNLSLAGYERYVALAFLFKSQRTFTRRKAARGSVAMWLYALFWSVMPLCGWSGFELEGIGTSCSLRWKSHDKLDLSYHICLMLACYVLPVSIIIASYYKSCCEIRKGAMRAKTTWGKKSPFTRKAFAVERKMVVLFGVMTVAFLVAWTPYAVVSLISMIAGPDVISDIGSSIPAYIAKSSACYNPIVYVFLYKRLRQRILLTVVRRRDSLSSSSRRPSNDSGGTGESHYLKLSSFKKYDHTAISKFNKSCTKAINEN